MRVGVQRDPYGGVAEHLRNHLGVHVLAEQERSARVAEVTSSSLVGFTPKNGYFAGKMARVSEASQID